MARPSNFKIFVLPWRAKSQASICMPDVFVEIG
jgi:hypothetical protein